MQVKNDPPCLARGRTRVSSASSRKTACRADAHRNLHAHLTEFVFSILMDCSAGKLRSRRTSLQHQIRDIRSPRAGFLWISSSVAGTRPERPVPAIPAPANIVNPTECWPIRSAREDQCHPQGDHGPNPHASVHFPGPGRISSPACSDLKSNKTRGGMAGDVSIPPSACIPPFALCFACHAPVRGV
jgi:hypothetical protein